MLRRAFLKNSGLLAAQALPDARPPRRAVLIMTDTTRADMLNCYRQTGLQTPHLDRLARGGVRFDRAYTCQPVCTPARAGLFTGTFPHSNGAWGNNIALGDNVHTIGQRLSGAGIHTAYIGKWHLDGFDYFGTGQCPAGWDRKCWFDGRNYLDELSPADRPRSRDPRTNRDPNLTADFTFAHRVTNRALEFLGSHRAEDFLLVLSYDEPHHPYLCPRPFSEMYPTFEFPSSPNRLDDLARKPEHQRLWSGERLARPPQPVVLPDYFGCHSFVDSQIGRVLDAIERHAPDALVIYTSDHGDLLGNHRLNSKGAAMYDEITRIPLLVRWPSHSPEGAICPHPVSHVDLAPSLLDYFGQSVPKALQGQSLLAAWRDPRTRINEAVFSEFGRYEISHDGFGGFQPIRCIFDGRYKLVLNLMDGDELYDLETDPGEMANLVSSPDHAKRRDELHDRLLDWMNRTRDPFRGYYWERRPWRSGKIAAWAGDGLTRQQEDDTYGPQPLDYFTGLPGARIRKQ